MSSPTDRVQVQLVRSLAGAGITAGTPVVVAFSGGPDSLALLSLLTRLPDRTRPAIEAVHVDHGLREGSAQEARSAAAAAEQLGVPCSVVRVEVRGAGEAAARRARYRALASTAGGRPVLTAHSSDDQAETLLLRLSRGSGLAGLTGARARTFVEGAWVIRPLLAATRADLRAIAAAAGPTPVEDPSNRAPAFARNRVRATVLPALEAALPGATRRLARAAALLADDEDYLERRTRQALARIALGEGVDARRLLRLPAALRRRIVRRLVRAACGRTPTSGHVEAVLHAARVEGEAHLPGGVLARCRAGVLTVGPGSTGARAPR